MWRWTGYTSYLACVFNMVSFWSGKPSKECESCRWERSTCVVSTIFFTLKKKTNSMQVKMLVIWTRNEINQGDEIRSPVLKRVDKWTIVRKLGMFILRRCPVLFSLVFIILVHWNFMKGYFLLERIPKNRLSSSLKIHERLLEFKVVNKRREKIASCVRLESVSTIPLSVNFRHWLFSTYFRWRCSLHWMKVSLFKNSV